PKPPRVAMPNQFPRVVFVADRMPVVVMPNLPMAFQAKDNSIIQCVLTFIRLLHDVVNVGVEAGELMTYTATPARAKKSFSFDVAKGHESRFHQGSEHPRPRGNERAV